MLLNLLRAKIHGARVTDANLEYEGSIEIDSNLVKEAGMLPFEKVHVLNVTNGERIETYVIPGTPGSKRICLNGAAARKAQVGDKVLILAYTWLDESELERLKPVILVMNDANEVVEHRVADLNWPEDES